jgi:hypothetical protein
MTWIDAPAGPFAQGLVDDARLRMDPYLLWADATGFAHTAFAKAAVQDMPPCIPVLMELAPGCDAEQLRRDEAQRPQGVPSSIALMPSAYGVGDRFLTAWVRPAFLARIAPGGDLQDRVVRLELGMPNMLETPPTERATRAPPTSRTDVLIGVIDDGCPFAHAALRRPDGGTRILSLWDQEPAPKRAAFNKAPAPDAPPAGFAYGREVGRAELDALAALATVGGRLDEGSCYEAANYGRLRHAATHGAHMLDLLAGPMLPASRVFRRGVQGGPPAQPSWKRRSPGHYAANDDIVFVQFPRDAIDDATGGWLCVHVLDAVHYILSCRRDADQRVVINLSYGSQVGPHDGSSTLECALRDLCERDKRLEIILPAGNSFGLQAHAGGSVSRPKGRSTKTRQFPGVRWSVPAGCEEPSFVELWMPSACGVGVRLVPPGTAAPPSPTVRPGQCKVWTDGGRPSVGIFHLAHPACGTQGSMVLLAMAPTAARTADAAVAPAGHWRIELDCDNDGAPQVDAYIARNDPNLGARRLGRTGRFLDAGYDPGRYLRAADDDLPAAGMPPCVVQRRGTLNWVAPTSADPKAPPRIQVVAGRVLNVQSPDAARAQFHPGYSSAGPSRDGAVAGPQASYVSDESLTLRGLRAAGTRSGATVRIVGTSTAAPQAARLRVNINYWAKLPLPAPLPIPLPVAEAALEGGSAFDPPDDGDRAPGASP